MNSRQHRLDRLISYLDRQDQQIKVGGITANRLPGAVPLIPGEALSSWFWRLQSQFKLPTAVMRSALGLSHSMFWMDAGQGNLDLEHLASTVMQSKSTLESLRLPKYSLLSEPLFACLTTVPLRRRPIYRYCETCLRDDPLPYVRQLWRFAGTYVCPVHHSVLRDFCPTCLTPFALPSGRQAQQGWSLRNCHCCGSDLCGVEPGVLSRELTYLVLAQQTELLTLFSVDSGLADLIRISPDTNGPKFEKKVGGIIDIASDGNVRALFQMLLEACLDKPVVHTKHARAVLDSYLLKWALSGTGGGSSSLAVGLDGESLFGEQAKFIAGYLIGRQDLWGGTYWWSLDRSDPLLSGPTFNNDDCRAAIAWVERGLECKIAD